MNNCTFAGRAGGPAELRSTGGGQSVANFSLAVDRFKKDAGPIWIEVTIWAKLAETVSKYITKGKQLVVTGEIDLQTYETRENGTKTKLTLNAKQITLMGGGEAAPEVDDPEGPTPF